MPVRNKEKPVKKTKNTTTAQQEQCSVVAIYCYLNKDMSQQANIDKLNKAMQDFDKQLAKDYGIKTGKSPNITIDDFVK